MDCSPLGCIGSSGLHPLSKGFSRQEEGEGCHFLLYYWPWFACYFLNTSSPFLSLHLLLLMHFIFDHISAAYICILINILQFYCCFSHWIMSDSFATLWTIALQAPLSVGFPRRRYWGGLPFPPSGGSFWPRDQTLVSCIERQILYHWAIREAHSSVKSKMRTQKVLFKLLLLLFFEECCLLICFLFSKGVVEMTHFLINAVPVSTVYCIKELWYLSLKQSNLVLAWHSPSLS